MIIIIADYVLTKQLVYDGIWIDFPDNLCIQVFEDLLQSVIVNSVHLLKIHSITLAVVILRFMDDDTVSLSLMHQFYRLRV